MSFFLTRYPLSRSHALPARSQLDGRRERLGATLGIGLHRPPEARPGESRLEIPRSTVCDRGMPGCYRARPPWPLVLLLLLLTTKYFSSGSVLIKAEDTFFAFTEQDVTMAGGCSGCIGLCKVIVLKYALFNGSAFVSSPIFNAFVALGRDESLYDFSL